MTHLEAGDRVVVPFNISCGSCWMCGRGCFAPCETTQNRSTGKGASLFGYTELYGSVPGGQAEYLRVPQAQPGPPGPARRAFPLPLPLRRVFGQGRASVDPHPGNVFAPRPELNGVRGRWPRVWG